MNSCSCIPTPVRKQVTFATPFSLDCQNKVFCMPVDFYSAICCYKTQTENKIFHMNSANEIKEKTE